MIEAFDLKTVIRAIICCLRSKVDYDFKISDAAHSNDNGNYHARMDQLTA
jgi:hypothetical protein